MRNNAPVPLHRKAVHKKEKLQDFLMEALSTEYLGEIDPETGDLYGFESRFAGKTNAEVVALRLAEMAAGGSLKAIEQILDRTLGKPKQAVETVSVKIGYQEYLESLAREENATHIDITPTPPDSTYDDLYDDDEDEDWLADL